MSFIPSSAASSATKSSISGNSSLIPLLAPASTLSLDFAQTPEGAAFLASLVKAALDSHYPARAPDLEGSEEKKSALKANRADKLPFSDFVRLFRNAAPEIRTLPIPAIESFQN